MRLVDEVYEIPAGDWRFVDVALHQRTARLLCSFRAQQPVKVSLLRREDLSRYRAARPVTTLAEAGPATSGAFQVRPPETGEYVLAIDNRGNTSAVRVDLRVDLDFGAAAVRVRYAEPWRRIAAIVLGFAIFAGVSLWSARKLLAARRGQHPL